VVKSSLADASLGKEPRKRDFEPRRVGIVRRARRNVSGEPASEAGNQCSMISLLLSWVVTVARCLLTWTRSPRTATAGRSSYHVGRIPNSLCSFLGSMRWNRRLRKRASERLTRITGRRVSTSPISTDSRKILARKRDFYNFSFSVAISAFSPLWTPHPARPW